MRKAGEDADTKAFRRSGAAAAPNLCQHDFLLVKIALASWTESEVFAKRDQEIAVQLIVGEEENGFLD
jgi:hypothetical protein